MSETGVILDLRIPSNSDKGRSCMYKIKRIHINGFRNISKTTIRFSDPVTVLLAPNNFGKTNVLHAIEFAANLVGRGVEAQESLLKDNHYTSYNVFSDDEAKDKGREFSFEIDFVADGDEIRYAFKISPHKGVLEESLASEYVTFFERRAEELSVHLPLDKINIVVSPYNLIASVLIDKDLKAGKYADTLRKLLFRMRSMFCNRESPHGEYMIEKKKKPIDSVIRLYRDVDVRQYPLFKEKFLYLFKEIEDFDIWDLYDRSRKVSRELLLDYRPEDYRIEFISSSKRRPELFSDLSTGTQDIFCLLLEVFMNRTKPLIMIEEIENGIHPSLFRKILETVDDVCKNNRVLVTTHSPSVARYFKTRAFSSFYVGVPNQNGRTAFKAIDENKEDEIKKMAKIHGCSIGEIIVDMLSDSDETIETLKGWLRG